jgi:hypothetical protein
LGTANVVLGLVWSIIARVGLVSNTVSDNVISSESIVIGTELAVLDIWKGLDIITELERFGKDCRSGIGTLRKTV